MTDSDLITTQNMTADQIQQLLIEEDLNLDKLITDFEMLRSAYADRNQAIDIRIQDFEGDHWTGDKEEVTQYQLVMNYTRNVVLRYAAILTRSPRPSVPSPGPIMSQESISANAREKFLLCLWDELRAAWRDVELNACKCSYGVLQVIWSPASGQPEQVRIGRGEDTTTARAYTLSPFKLRSIPPKNFYPVYRTFDTPNDFQSVFRFDPGRLVVDLEQRYGVSLQPTGLDNVLNVMPTCDLIEYWTNSVYVLIAKTQIQKESDSRGARRKMPEMVFQYYVIQAGRNPHGRIPFWVLQNIRSDPNEDPTFAGSMSDLDDITQLVQHVEEIVSEEAQEVVTHIHQPLVYKSEEHMQDPASIEFTAGAVYPIGIEEELEGLNWNPDTTLAQNHVDRVFGAVQDLSFLGEAGFGRIPQSATGIGFKIALTPMEQIVELKLPNRVDTLKSVCSFLLRAYEKLASKDARMRKWISIQYGRYGLSDLKPEDVNGQYYTDITFGNLLPRDDQLHEQSEVYKYKTGAQSLYTTLDNIGTHDPGREMDRIREELQDPILNPDHAIKLKQLQMMSGQQQQPQPGMAPGGIPGQMGGQKGPPGMPGMLNKPGAGAGQPGQGAGLPGAQGFAARMMGGGIPGMGGGPGMGPGGMGLPGGAQPGTNPLDMMSMGGMGGMPGMAPGMMPGRPGSFGAMPGAGMGGMPGAAPPGIGGAMPGEEEQRAMGANVPFMKRGRNG